MTTERNEKIREMRLSGMTYRDIAEKYGISVQRVQQIAGSVCYFRPVSEKDCIYKGIRDWLNANRYSRTYLVRLMYGDTHAMLQEKVSNVLKGSNCTKKMIDKLLEVTGLPYEVAFKVEGNNDR